jgi:hypothetical protein
MYSDAPTDTLIEGIKSQLDGHQDTLYCTKAQESALKSEISTPGLFSQNVDNLRFMGLDVQVLPRIDRPIVCQKGEVFTLAKDYKNGDV